MGRIAVILLVALAAVPSIMPFETGDPATVCVPVKDGWARERPVPAEVDWSDAPPPEDTDALRRWLATPEMERSMAYTEWRFGPGECLDESHDRMLLSGIGVVPGAALAIALRLRRRP